MGPLERVVIVSHQLDTIKRLKRSIWSQSRWKNCFFECFDSIELACSELSVLFCGVIVVDCPSFDKSPLELLIRLRAADNKTPLILMNNPGQEKVAISCLKNGASYYHIKDKHWEKELVLVIELVLNEQLQRDKLKKTINRLSEENSQLKKNSVYDSTQLFYSADHFKSLLNRELSRAHRYNSDLTCIVLDVQAQPKTPSSHRLSTEKETAVLLKSLIRSSDIWARMDSNRFAALFPHTTILEAKNATKRIRSEISTAPLKINKKSFSVKISCGIAQYDKSQTFSEKELLEAATKNLSTFQSG